MCLCEDRICVLIVLCIFFFNDTATTEIYTLSLHDALPISGVFTRTVVIDGVAPQTTITGGTANGSSSTATSASFALDRKSTRLNSSHANISYAVFCLKKKTRGNAAPPCRPHLATAPMILPT